MHRVLFNLAPRHLMLLVLLLVSLGNLGLIWTEAVELRNGDYSGRMVHAQNIPLNSEFFTNHIWRHFWPPLPLIFTRILLAVFAMFGLSTAVAIKLVLSVSVLIGTCSLWLIFRLVSCFTDTWNGLIAAIMVAALPVYHLIYTSAISQVLALPLLLLGTFSFARSLNREWPVAIAGVWFLLASLCRTETVIISGLLSMMLLPQRRWGAFLGFNLLAGGFFMLHQSTLIFFASVNYLDWSKYYNFDLLDNNQRLAYVLGQLGQAFGLEVDALTIGLFTALLLLAGLGQWVIIRYPGRYSRSSRLVFLSWVFALLFILALPFITEHQRGRHTRDLLFGLTILAMLSGIALAQAPKVFDRWGSPTIAIIGRTLLVLVMVGLVVRGVWFASEIRTVPPGLREARAWLAANASPEMPVVFENSWSGYLYAYHYVSGQQHLHWSMGRALYGIEVGTDSGALLLEEEDADIYDQVVASATYFMKNHAPKFIVTLPTDNLEATRRRSNLYVNHRAKPAYLLPLMFEEDHGMRRLILSEGEESGPLLRRVFANSACHIWEVLAEEQLAP